MDFLLNRHTSFDWWKKSFKYCLVYFSFRQSIHWKNHIWLESLCFRTDCGISVSQAKRTQPIATPQIDICKNKQEFSDFRVISYCFVVHIVMLIIIQMHLVLLTTISLLFVWGALLNKFEKRQGLEPPKPPFCTCLQCIHLTADHYTIPSEYGKTKSL